MFLALLAAAAAPASSAPPMPRPVTTLEATSKPSMQESGKTDELALHDLPDDRLTVAVSLGDHGPFRFLVDTGADRTVVSHQLARKLGLPAGSGVRMHSVTGTSTVRTASVKGLRVAARSLPDINAPLLDANHVRADGILGTDVLRSAQVRFDFRAGLLSISAARTSRRNAEPDTVVVEARRRAGRLIVTEAEVDGQPLVVVLDTGSEVTIGNGALRNALARRGFLSEDRVVELASVTGEKLLANYTFVRNLEIGGLNLSDLGVAFADAHTFKVMGLEQKPALLLGMNALRAFDSVTIDLAAKKLRFKLPEEGSRGELAARWSARPGG